MSSTNRNLPEPLQNDSFRFILLQKDTKNKPIEKGYKENNNYLFFEPKLRNHLLKGGNVAALTGYGGLIVIDFDDLEFQRRMEHKMPKTFTTKSAGKGLKHFYYLLDGPMIKKIGIDSPFNKGKRLCDIQAGKEPICCPPSNIKDKLYQIVEDYPIVEIKPFYLMHIFHLNELKEARKEKRYADDTKNPKKVQEAVDLFKELKIERAHSLSYACPFHESASKACLRIFQTGSIFCFHCSFWAHDSTDFMVKWKQHFQEIEV